MIGPWDSLEVPGNPWQFLEPPQIPCVSQALPATPCAPSFSRKDRPCLGNETNEKLAQGPSWPYGPHGLMRPLYTSSVYRRRLGSSDRARADAMGGSSAEASPQFFPHRFSKGQACALGSSEVIVLSAYSHRTLSEISAKSQRTLNKLHPNMA